MLCYKRHAMAEAQQILAEEDAPSFLDPKLHDAAHAVARAWKAHMSLGGGGGRGGGGGGRVVTADAVGAAFMAD